MTEFILILSFAVLITGIVLIVLNVKAIRAYLYKLSMKHQIGSLRSAIHKADKNKEKNDRKNIVVFNSVSKKFEPVEKKLLKNISERTKNKSNKAMTDGRKRMMKPLKKRSLSSQRIHTIENKSVYVTR